MSAESDNSPESLKMVESDEIPEASTFLKVEEMVGFVAATLNKQVLSSFSIVAMSSKHLS